MNDPIEVLVSIEVRDGATQFRKLYLVDGNARFIDVIAAAKARGSHGAGCRVKQALVTIGTLAERTRMPPSISENAERLFAGAGGGHADD